LRDARRHADAAEAYRAVLALAPQRIDILVQYGNMLKYSGLLAEAEVVTGPRWPKNRMTLTYIYSSDTA
jgi:hypothetical protein